MSMTVGVFQKLQNHSFTIFHYEIQENSLYFLCPNLDWNLELIKFIPLMDKSLSCIEAFYIFFVASSFNSEFPGGLVLSLLQGSS